MKRVDHDRHHLQWPSQTRPECSAPSHAKPPGVTHKHRLNDFASALKRPRLRCPHRSLPRSDCDNPKLKKSSHGRNYVPFRLNSPCAARTYVRTHTHTHVYLQSACINTGFHETVSNSDPLRTAATLFSRFAAPSTEHGHTVQTWSKVRRQTPKSHDPLQVAPPRPFEGYQMRQQYKYRRYAIISTRILTICSMFTNHYRSPDGANILGLCDKFYRNVNLTT